MYKMLGFTKKIFHITLFGGMLLVSACGAAAPEDIPVTPSVEAQFAPLPTQAMEIKSEGVPAPTAGLPTEIIEPNSPISSCTADTNAGCEPTAIIAQPVSPVAPASVEPAQPAQQLVAPDVSPAQPLPGSETALAAAIADLVKQAGVPANQITLVSMEAKDWGDTALGCPQEGMMYAQVITPGYLMMFEAQGQQYEYHTDQTTNVVWCKK
jgi:hypothetical protein